MKKIRIPHVGIVGFNKNSMILSERFALDASVMMFIKCLCDFRGNPLNGLVEICKCMSAELSDEDSLHV